MKILIAGNMGYIGPVVVRQLRAAYPDATLVGFDMGYFGNCLTGNEILPECRVDLQHFGDIRKFPKHILRGVDAVVQLAAISNDPMGKMFEQVTFEVNHLSSVLLAKMAKSVGVKAFVFPSSCSVYGFTDGCVKDEDSVVDPLTAYAKSKILAERDLVRLADKDFRITCLRFATACGMSERLRLDLVLNDFVASAVACRNITILSDGTPWRPLIHVNDMARAVDWAITREGRSCGSFLAINIGSDEWNYQVKDLANAVAEHIPDVEVSINTNGQPDKRSYRVSFEKFKKLAPDYQPVVDLSGAITELRNALEAMAFQNKDFRNSRFARLVVLKSLRSRGLLSETLEWCDRGSNGRSEPGGPIKEINRVVA